MFAQVDHYPQEDRIDIFWGTFGGTCNTSYYELRVYDYYTEEIISDLAGISYEYYYLPIFFPGPNLPQVQIRTVCDCSDQGGAPITYGDWVDAPTNNIFCDTEQPDIGFECVISAPSIDVSEHSECNTSNSIPLKFVSLYQTGYQVPNGDFEYLNWRKFSAPSSGQIDISLFSVVDPSSSWAEFHNNFGFVILNGGCNGNTIHTTISTNASETVNVTNLSPGASYIIGVWNNDFPYTVGYIPQCDYNGTLNFMTICDAHIPEEDCPADLNLDGIVDINDFLTYNSAFGQFCTSCLEDINNDGVVDVSDFLELNTAFGDICD